MKITMKLGRYDIKPVMKFIRVLAEASRESRMKTESEQKSLLTERDLERAREGGLIHRDHRRDVMSIAEKELAMVRARIQSEKDAQEAIFLRKVLDAHRVLGMELERRLAEVDSDKGSPFLRKRMADIAEAKARIAGIQMEPSAPQMLRQCE